MPVWRSLITGTLDTTALVIRLCLLVGVFYAALVLAINSPTGVRQLSGLLSQVLEAEVEVRHLVLSPTLQRVHLHDVVFRDDRGRETIAVRYATCRWRPDQLRAWRVHFEDCLVRDGRVLVNEDEDGFFGIERIFAGTWQEPGRADRPPTWRFVNVTLENIDVNMNLEDALFRFDGVDLRQAGFAISGESFHLAVGDARIRGGRVLVSERLLNLGDGLPDWAHVAWEQARRTRPRAISYGAIPIPPEGERGWLDLPMRSASIEDFWWDDYWFGFGQARFDLESVQLEAEGRVRVIPDRPKLPQRERAVLSVDGGARIEVAPDSPVLDWALPGVTRPWEGEDAAPRIEPLVFDAYGTMRFFEGSTRLELGDMDLLGWRIESFEADLILADGELRLGEGAMLRMWDGEVTGAGRFVPRTGDWSLSLCVDSVDLGRALAPWAGELSAEVRRFGEGRLSTTPARCDPEGTSGLQASGELTLKALEVAPAATTPVGRTIQAPMLSVRARDLRLGWGRLPPWLTQRQARMDLTFTLDQRGVVNLWDGAQPGLRFRVGGDSLRMAARVDTVAGEIADGRVRLQTRNLAPWLARNGLGAPIPLEVDLVADAWLSGPIADPVLGRVEATWKRAPGTTRLPEMEGSAQLRRAGNALVVQDFDLRSDFGDLRMGGRVNLFRGSLLALRPDPGLALDVELRDVALAVLTDVPGLNARLNADLRVEGRVSEPEVEGRVEAWDVLVFEEPLDHAEVNLRFANGRLAIEGGRIRKGRGTLTVEGAVDTVEEQLALQVSGRELWLQEVAVVDGAGVDVRGALRFDLDIKGPWSTPAVEGSAAVQGLRVDGRDLGNGSLSIYTFGEVIEVTGSLSEDIALDAQIPLYTGPLVARARFHGLALEEWLREFRGVFRSSALSGELRATWDPGGDDTLVFDLDLRSAEIQVGERTFRLAEPARARWWNGPDLEGIRRSRLIVDNFPIDSGGPVLRVEGIWEDWQALDFTVEGQLDFSMLTLLPDLVVDAEGLADVELEIQGSLQEPRVRGVVLHDEARIAPRGMGTNLFLRPGRLVLSESAIRIPADEPMRGTLYGGDFSAEGDIGLVGLLPANLDLQIFIVGMTYRIPNQASVTLNADVAFLAADLEDASTWLVSGDVEVVEGRYFQDFDIIGDQFAIGGFRRPVTRFEPPVWEQNETLGQLGTDLRITGRDRFLVESRVAAAALQLELQLDLELSGPLNRMVLIGEAEVIENSTVTYRGRTFDVERALLFFDGFRDADGYPMPLLDAELVASIRPCTRSRTDSLNVGVDLSIRDVGVDENVLLTMLLNGRLPYDVGFQLESTPLYDQRDLLSLIVTGCTLDELTAATAGSPTLDILFRPVIDAVERSVEDRLDVDEVELIPAADGSAEIIVRDEITERFRWTFNARVGSDIESRQSLRGEYRLLDWLSLELREQSGREENLTIDTGFRFRFRLD